MKHKANFRLIFTTLTFVIILGLLESKRIKNRSIYNKANKQPAEEAKDFKVSNTDYIFFESLNKHLFFSLQK